MITGWPNERLQVREGARGKWLLKSGSVTMPCLAGELAFCRFISSGTSHDTKPAGGCSSGILGMTPLVPHSRRRRVSLTRSLFGRFYIMYLRVHRKHLQIILTREETAQIMVRMKCSLIRYELVRISEEKWSV